jgi:hypothetical protein
MGLFWGGQQQEEGHGKRRPEVFYHGFMYYVAQKRSRENNAMHLHVIRTWFRFKRFVKGFPPLHPLLAGIYPVLALYSLNADQLWPSVVIKPILWSMSGIVFLWIFSFLYFHRWDKGAIFSTALVFFFFGYGYGIDLLSWMLSFPSEKTLGWIFLSPLLFGAGLLARRLKMAGEVRGFTVALNLSFSVLLVFPLLSMAFQPRSPGMKTPDAESPLEIPGPSNGRTKRDIYFIILDAYARRDVLKNLFGYDNGWFLRELSKRGFQISKESRSNYSITFLSLASSLNMTYLDDLVADVRRTSVDRDIPTQMIRDSQVQRFLKKQGYKVVHLSSGWAVTEHNPGADKVYGAHSPQEFLAILYRPTLWGILFPDRIQNGWRELIFNNLETLSRSASIPGPKFVFAHFVCPHEPFVFYPDGSDPRPDFIREDYRRRWTKGNRYLGNLVFISRRILKAVDDILASSPVKPIIILESDHGPATQLFSSRLSERVSESVIHERMSNLVSLYLPGPDSPRIPRDFTPVNTFRILFDSYFGTRLGMLENRSYYCDPARPYDLLDVSTCCTAARNPFEGMLPKTPLADLPES